MTYYIYEVTNTVTGKKYIGQTSNPDTRKEKHLTDSHNASLKKDITKLGRKAFEFEIIDETDDPIKINFMEINYIEQENYPGTKAKLYNKSSGGQLVHNVDKYICNNCENSYGLTMINNEKAGILLFRVSSYPSSVVEECYFLCHNCHFDCDGEPHPYCMDHERFPYSKMLAQNALMDLVMTYTVPEEMINKLIIVDGKINTKMAYAYFTKRLDYK